MASTGTPRAPEFSRQILVPLYEGRMPFGVGTITKSSRRSGRVIIDCEVRITEGSPTIGVATDWQAYYAHSQVQTLAPRVVGPPRSACRMRDRGEASSNAQLSLLDRALASTGPDG